MTFKIPTSVWQSWWLHNLNLFLITERFTSCISKITVCNLFHVEMMTYCRNRVNVFEVKWFLPVPQINMETKCKSYINCFRNIQVHMFFFVTEGRRDLCVIIIHYFCVTAALFSFSFLVRHMRPSQKRTLIQIAVLLGCIVYTCSPPKQEGRMIQLSEFIQWQIDAIKENLNSLNGAWWEVRAWEDRRKSFTISLGI